MALSDSDNRKYMLSKKRRDVNAPTNKHWSDSQKIEAVQTYLALGTITTTAAVLKIPEVTLRVWKSKDWWKEIEQELRHQDDLVLSSRLQRIIANSFDQVEDRLKNGDFVYDQKTGELKRRPVNLRDAHKVAVDLIDKREYLIKKTPDQLSNEAIDDKLTKLAQKFAEIAQGVKPIVQVTDVIIQEKQEQETDNAVYEEWEEGLQEGGQVGQEPSGTDEGPGGTP